MDALGNFTSVSGTTETNNKQNEATGFGSATLTYDSNGNLTTDQNGNTLVYDAWNRLVAYKNGSTTLETLSYDGLGRQVVVNPGTATDLYYSDQWQVLEERVGGAAKVHYVWSAVYVDALVLRDRDATGSGTLSERLWVQQDANWNVTALVNGSGTVVERYVYDPYGNVTVLTASWGSTSGSAYAWIYGHQGGRLDTTTGLYGFRNRDESVTMDRWTEVDPSGFGAGDNNLYRFTHNSPVNAVDPSGLVWVRTGKYTEAIRNTGPRVDRIAAYKRSNGQWVQGYTRVDPNGAWVDASYTAPQHPLAPRFKWVLDATFPTQGWELFAHPQTRYCHEEEWIDIPPIPPVPVPVPVGNPVNQTDITGQQVRGVINTTLVAGVIVVGLGCIAELVPGPGTVFGAVAIAAGLAIMAGPGAMPAQASTGGGSSSRKEPSEPISEGECSPPSIFSPPPVSQTPCD